MRIGRYIAVPAWDKNGKEIPGQADIVDLKDEDLKALFSGPEQTMILLEEAITANPDKF